MAVADRDGWRAFGYGGLSPLSGRANQVVPGPFAPLIGPRVEGMHAPFVGVRPMTSCAAGSAPWTPR